MRRPSLAPGPHPTRPSVAPPRPRAHHRAVALLGLAVLAGCAVTPPAGVATTSTAPVPATSTAMTPTTSAPTTPVASVPVTSAPANAVVLAGDRIGTQKIGTAEAPVEGYLTSQLGKPDDVYAGPVCELDSDTAYGRQLAFGSVFVQFQSAAGKGKTAPRKLTGWVMTLGDTPRPPLQLPAGYPAKPSYDELKKAFPTGKLSKISLGEGSFWTFTTPGGLWYRGDNADSPDQAGAGKQGACE